MWSQLNRDIDLVSTWREKWSLADAKNHSLIDDPTAHVPGFYLPHGLWNNIGKQDIDGQDRLFTDKLNLEPKKRLVCSVALYAAAMDINADR